MGPGNYQLWVANVDRHGKALHADVVQAAEAIGNGFFSYRRSEIQCESLANAIVQNTVEFTSRIHEKIPIENLPRYLHGAYKRNVNKFLARQARIQICDSEIIDEGLASRPWKCREVARIEGTVFLHELVGFLKPEARHIFFARVAGYDTGQIAAHLRVRSRKKMALRYFRGLRSAVHLAGMELDINFSAHGANASRRRNEKGQLI